MIFNRIIVDRKNDKIDHVFVLKDTDSDDIVDILNDKFGDNGWTSFYPEKDEYSFDMQKHI